MHSSQAEVVGRVVLADGEMALVRPVTPADAEALRKLHRELCLESRYFRYFSARKGIGERELERFTHPDGVHHDGLVAFVAGQLVGHACFDRAEPGLREAELAFEVADAHHGRGLGTLLVEALAARARSAGIDAFSARVLPQNRLCLEVFRDLGFREQARFADGAVSVRFELAPTEEHRAAAAQRRAKARCARARRASAPSQEAPCTSSWTSACSTR